jgi:DMSO/TMAO reductase YedYZ molybdopterin-dependent catalytic subunit
MMAVVSRGFGRGRRRGDANLPPGQYLVDDFPVLSAGPTPWVPLDRWRLTVTTETGVEHAWSWPELLALPAERFTVDLHCVTKWSKLDTTWEGVPLDTLLDDVETAADYALVERTAATPRTCRSPTC